MADAKAPLIQILVLLVLQNVNNANGVEPLVETDAGLIKGLVAADGNYSMFLGIPYAKVNLENPFGPAIKYPVFNGSFEAYDDSARCPQFDESNGIGIGTLDCLNLNIYVPDSASSQNPLPVMVYIHGGSFSRGTGVNQGPKFLVRHNVVLVTMNYRLGVYGFMCLGTAEIPGNQGLKDQLLALRWVNKNIKQFGGDPDNVTLFGLSAGARSVDYHLMANDEKLFSKAILQSGNSVSSPSIGIVNTDLPITLAEKHGFQTNDFRQAVSFLTTVEPRLLVSTGFSVVGTMFQTCVETEIDEVDVFVPDYTINRKVPKVRTTPILTGFASNEKYEAHVNRNDNAYENFFSDFLNIYFNLDNNERDSLEKIVRNFYIGGEEITKNVRQQLADFDSDFTYVHPIRRGIEQYISNNATKIYYYMFAYVGERNIFSNMKNVTTAGPVHADDIAYLFDLPKFRGTVNPADQLMIDRMTTMWTNFAKYGDPTPEISTLLPVKWEPMTLSDWKYYHIDSDLTLKRQPLNRRMSFIDLLFKMNHYRQKGLQNKT